MSYATLVVEAEELAAAEVVVRGGAYRHLFRARRLTTAERIRLVDGRGAAVWARVEQLDAACARLVVEAPAPANEPAAALEIWVGMPRSQRASWLVEKVTELGATAVRWLASARGPRRLRPPALERLRRVARGAVEQCHRSRLPEITGPHSWRELGARLGEVDAAWVLDPSAPPPLGVSSGRRWLLLVGPEGGFDDAERAELAARGVERIGLGPRMLRIETAAVAGTALLLSGPGRPSGSCDEVV